MLRWGYDGREVAERWCVCLPLLATDSCEGRFFEATELHIHIRAPSFGVVGRLFVLDLDLDFDQYL
jgi:hypothetical protein